MASSTSAENEPPKHARKNASVPDIAGERSVNVKDYLIKEKGIDANRIIVATITTDGQQVQDYLVPAGASYSADVPGTTPVDEYTVKPQVRKPLRLRHHAH